MDGVGFGSVCGLGVDVNERRCIFGLGPLYRECLYVLFRCIDLSTFSRCVRRGLLCTRGDTIFQSCFP